MKELNQQEKDFIKDSITYAESLGLVCIHGDIISDQYILEENNYIKVNLPDNESGFKTGNGEGVWAVPYTTEDLSISTSNVVDTSFNVVLLNDSIYYPFKYGTILNVSIISEEQRPVLTYNWIDEIIKKTSNGETTLADTFE